MCNKWERGWAYKLCGKSTETAESCNDNSRRPQVLSVLAPPRRAPYFSPPKRCHPANMCTQYGNSVQNYHSCVHILCDCGSQCVWQRPVVQQKGCLSEILIGHKGILLTNACRFYLQLFFSNERRQWLTLTNTIDTQASGIRHNSTWQSTWKWNLFHSKWHCAKCTNSHWRSTRGKHKAIQQFKKV